MTTTAKTEQGYRLPFGDVFKTQHSTERNWRTANENLALLSEVGSRLHGIAVGGDDQDLCGVCVEPQEVMLGTNRFEQYEYRTVPVGHPSGEGDIDLTVFGLSKFVGLITKGNPSQMLPLFAPLNQTLSINWVGQELRDNIGLFMARGHGRKFLGYMNSQRARLLGEEKNHTPNRPDLVEKYGYDTKFAAHALRIAMQGAELLRTQKIVLPMETRQRNYLIKVREGHYTLDEVLGKMGRVEADLAMAAEYSVVLPEYVDFDFVNDWLVSIYQRWWAGER